MQSLEDLRKMLDNTDKKMAELFTERMAYCEKIAEIKQKNGFALEDSERESRMLLNNSLWVEPKYREFYVDFLKNNIALSKKYQAQLGGESYVIIKRGALKNVYEYFNLKRKVLIITDNGVPKEYVNTVYNASKTPFVFTFKQGEKSKNIDTLNDILTFLTNNGFEKSDCIVALGGGVVGDISGFAAGIYMRGIDFYMIPTTTLSAVDSCVGGKTAIDFGGAKNTVGMFYFAKKILIDCDTLKTLNKRNFNAGLIEAVKMGVTLNEELLKLFENGNISDNLDKIVSLSIAEKQKIVNMDKTDNKIRHCLNFGHTIGHAIETVKGDLLHGECVAGGMLYVCSDEVKTRLIKIYNKLGIEPITLSDAEKVRVKEVIKKDKKIKNNKIYAVFCDEAASFKITDMDLNEFIKRVNL